MTLDEGAFIIPWKSGASAPRKEREEIWASAPATRHALQDRLALRIPENLLARPVRLCGHHASDGMRESLTHRSVGLLPRTHTFKPVRHVFQRQVVNTHRWQLGFSRQRHKRG